MPTCCTLKSSGRQLHPSPWRASVANPEIRRNLIQRGLIKGIIGLPANLFYGTGIPACIVVIDKRDAGSREGIFVADVDKGFIKDGPKSLRERDIHKIVDVFTRQLEVPAIRASFPMRRSRYDYNLNLPRYIDSSEADDLQVTCAAASPSATSTPWNIGGCAPRCGRPCSRLAIWRRWRRPS